MDLRTNKFSVQSPLIGLLLAAILPVLGLTFFNPESLFIVIFIAIPISILCMLLVGTPAYILLKKLGLLNLPFCILGGVLCSLPGSFTFSPSGLPIEFSLSNYLSFSLLGASGGLVFWIAFARSHGNSQSRIGKMIGVFILSVLIVVFYHLNQFKEIDYLNGETPINDIAFLTEYDRQVPVLIEGKHVEARLAASVPYRKNCRISFSKWRDLWTHETKYSISHYPDQPRAHQYKVLSEESKVKVTEICDGSEEVLIY